MKILSLHGTAGKKENHCSFLKRALIQKELFLILLIPVIYYIVFCYMPMGGIIIAFKQFSFRGGMFAGEWVGLRWFNEFFNSMYFTRLISNTFLINIYSLIFGFPTPIIFALALNEVRKRFLKSTVQTITYIPHFMSMVVVVGMLVNILSPTDGVINIILNSLGLPTHDFITDPKWFRTLYVGSGIWQEFGFGSILYLAAIAGINPEIYEASELDGASRLQKLLYITLPSLIPTITIILILRMGSLFNVGFEKLILMYSPATYSVGDVISTYVYRRGLLGFDYSFATAVGFFNSIVNFIFIVFFNKLASRMGENKLW